jgi:hypothetical protein
MSEEHPLNQARLELPDSPQYDLPFPPPGWQVIQPWGCGWALQNSNGLRAIIDCERKEDDRYWVHLSISRVGRTPTHEDMAAAKRAFFGDAHYAYSVFPPKSKYVNIHGYCLHLWALAEGDGRVLPEFSGVVAGVTTI